MLKARISKNARLSSGDLFVVLNLIDYCTTNLLITTGGEELMPLAASIISEQGMTGLLLYKLSLTFFVVITSKKLFTKSAWSLLNGAFSGIVLWNTIGLAANCLYSLL